MEVKDAQINEMSEGKQPTMNYGYDWLSTGIENNKYMNEHWLYACTFNFHSGISRILFIYILFIKPLFKSGEHIITYEIIQ